MGTFFLLFLKKAPPSRNENRTLFVLAWQRFRMLFVGMATLKRCAFSPGVCDKTAVFHFLSSQSCEPFQLCAVFAKAATATSRSPHRTARKPRSLALIH